MSDQRLSRREMLARTGLVTAALGLSPVLEALFANAQHRGFKIGICEWMLGKPDHTSLDVAKEIGVDGMQANMGNLKNDMQLRRSEVQKAYLDTARKHGLEISSIGVAEMNNTPLKSDPRAEPWLLESIDVAKALGVKVILLAFFYKNDLKNDKPGTDRVVELLKKAAPIAEKQDVIYGIESWLSADEHLDIISRVGSPALTCYYDVGNSHKMGYDIYKEIRQLGKQICEFHAKDYDNIYGTGQIDFGKVREAMDDIGYRGWIQIESGSKLGPVPSYKANREYLKTIFPPKV
jgi:sugar phosphate isomerase/epimerase